jgi:hypothetical protein
VIEKLFASRLFRAFWLALPFQALVASWFLSEWLSSGNATWFDLIPFLLFSFIPCSVILIVAYRLINKFDELMDFKRKGMHLKASGDSATCPYCKTAFNDRDDTVRCLWCGVTHHRECWEQNGRCSVFNCPGTTTIKPHTPESDKTSEKG